MMDGIRDNLWRQSDLAVKNEVWGIDFILQSTGGALSQRGASASFARINTDSRSVRDGDLFVAIRGDAFDGHDFLKTAVAAGAVAVLVDRPTSLPENVTIVSVVDSRRALGKIAAAHRVQFDIPVFAIAGSNGKTTTKELLASCLSQRMPTLRSIKSFNNDIGVPLTLLGLASEHGAAVLEAGTNHPGELAPLIRMISPQFGVMTSLGAEHLEHFIDMAGVVAEECLLAELLPSSGKLFLYGDSQWSSHIASRCSAEVIQIGSQPHNDWRLLNVTPSWDATRFVVEAPIDSMCGEFEVRLIGRHQAMNALLAISAAASIGLSRTEIAKGLAECAPAPMRMSCWTVNGVRVLDDAYNANVDSMKAALQTLESLPVVGRRIAVLGEMAELGDHTITSHQEIGAAAAAAGCDVVVAVGSSAGHTTAAASAGGVREVIEFAEIEAAGEWLLGQLREGDAVLLKASRSMRFERLAELLKAMS